MTYTVYVEFIIPHLIAWIYSFGRGQINPPGGHMVRKKVFLSPLICNNYHKWMSHMSSNKLGLVCQTIPTSFYQATYLHGRKLKE